MELRNRRTNALALTLFTTFSTELYKYICTYKYIGSKIIQTIRRPRDVLDVNVLASCHSVLSCFLV